MVRGGGGGGGLELRLLFHRFLAELRSQEKTVKSEDAGGHFRDDAGLSGMQRGDTPDGERGGESQEENESGHGEISVIF